MTKSELVARISNQHPELSVETINRSVDVILKQVSDSLALGRRLELRGFGSFALRRRASRTGRNPRTGDSVFVRERYVPHFKPGKILRNRVNHQHSREHSAIDPAERNWQN